MRNRGFTLIELLVTFAIISVIAGIMMSVLLNLKARSDKTYALTQIAVTQANITKKIESDLRSYKLTSITNCGVGCYNMTYNTLGTKQLLLTPASNKIAYGTYTKILPTGAVLGSAITITTSYTTGISSGNNSILKISVSITNTYNDQSFNILVIYQYVDTDLTLTL